MDHQITTEDLEFMRWLDSKEAEQFWERDYKGEKMILHSGWDKAQTGYQKIMGLKKKP